MDNKKGTFVTPFQVITSNTTNKCFECADLTFVNTGTVAVTIFAGSGLLLNPGQSITIPSYRGAKNMQAYRFVFAAKANGCNLVVITQDYTD